MANGLNNDWSINRLVIAIIGGVIILSASLGTVVHSGITGQIQKNHSSVENLQTDLGICSTTIAKQQQATIDLIKLTDRLTTQVDKLTDKVQKLEIKVEKLNKEG